MNPHQFFHPSQPSGFQPVGHPPPQLAYPHYPAGTSPMHGGYVGWNPDVQVPLYNANVEMAGAPPAGMAAGTTGVDYQCRWMAGDAPCGANFHEFDDLVDHLRRHHDVQGAANRKLDCKWLVGQTCCDKNYRRDRFRRHVGTHVGLQVPCTECDKVFSREDSMRAHRNKKHWK